MRRRGIIDAAELITPQVAEAIAALGLGAEHAGMVKLALIYAAAIDGAGMHCSSCDDGECKRADRSWAVRWIGPNLHASLESLGASPASEAAITRAKGGAKPDGEDALSGLRTRRRGA
jgi:hypothetical protein